MHGAEEEFIVGVNNVAFCTLEFTKAVEVRQMALLFDYKRFVATDNGETTEKKLPVVRVKDTCGQSLKIYAAEMAGLMDKTSVNHLSNLLQSAGREDIPKTDLLWSNRRSDSKSNRRKKRTSPRYKNRNTTTTSRGREEANAGRRDQERLRLRRH